MNRLVLGFGLALTASINLLGCAGGDEECMPGDIDCSEDGGGGKADEWDYTNDPARLANNLQYRLSELPRAGKLDQPVWKSRFPNAPSTMNPIWAETYFPSSQGSTNARWQGASEPSALEKYDQAFNNVTAPASQPSARCGDGAKAAWDSYFAVAGPAAKWHAQNFQYMANGYNGRDDDNNGQVDECSGGVDGWGPDRTPAGWWGLCHAWTPASILEPEAINPVTYNGVTFHRSDIHALVMTIYDKNDALMLGGRCNAEEYNPDNTTDANEPCADSNPGAVHVVLANFLGIADQAIAFDRTATGQVWNQPIYSYEVTKLDEVSASKAYECVGASGDSYEFNTKAKKFYDTKMSVTYVVEPSASRNVLPMTDHLSTDSFHYVLEINDDGKIIGGRYCTDSDTDHPDFMWAPKGPSSSSSGRNPSVSLEKVRQLLNLSVNGEGGGGGGGSGTTFESGTINASIPDNNPTGITNNLSVSGVSGSGGVAVSVDISHTYRGDLVVTLLKDGHEVKVLHNGDGGSTDNLVQTWNLSASELGASDRNGSYSLKVVDTAAEDTGMLNKWSLVF